MLQIPHKPIGKYLTVYNIMTRRSVPFIREATGEIRINSSRIEDNEDSCIVMIGNLFHEHSIDFERKTK